MGVCSYLSQAGLGGLGLALGNSDRLQGLGGLAGIDLADAGLLCAPPPSCPGRPPTVRACPTHQHERAVKGAAQAAVAQVIAMQFDSAGLRYHSLDLVVDISMFKSSTYRCLNHRCGASTLILALAHKSKIRPHFASVGAEGTTSLRRAETQAGYLSSNHCGNDMVSQLHHSTLVPKAHTCWCHLSSQPTQRSLRQSLPWPWRAVVVVVVWVEPVTGVVTPAQQQQLAQQCHLSSFLLSSSRSKSCISNQLGCEICEESIGPAQYSACKPTEGIPVLFALLETLLPRTVSGWWCSGSWHWPMSSFSFKFWMMPMVLVLEFLCSRCLSL